MPTIFSHAMLGTVAGALIRSGSAPPRFWILTAVCPVLPDADVIAFIFRVPYTSMFGHRGITHSFLFALFVGSLAAALCFASVNISRWKLIVYFTIITSSHTLLDMLTNGGLGVALFAPFSNERFFFPWRPIDVSPIGAGFFSGRGLAVIGSEVLWIWIPSLAMLGIALLTRRRSVGRESSSDT